MGSHDRRGVGGSGMILGSVAYLAIHLLDDPMSTGSDLLTFLQRFQPQLESFGRFL